MVGTERRLSELKGGFRAKVEKVLRALTEEWEPLGRVPFVVETRRSVPVQMAYFSRGRMKPEDVQRMYKAAGLWTITPKEAQTYVTWTMDSKHLDGAAIDIVPSLPNKPTNPDWAAPRVVWDAIGRAAQKEGLEWGGSWKDKYDAPHVEEK